jgi:hypothetical protein
MGAAKSKPKPEPRTPKEKRDAQIQQINAASLRGIEQDWHNWKLWTRKRD